MKYRNQRVFIANSNGGFEKKLVRDYLKKGARVMTCFTGDTTSADELMESISSEDLARLKIFKGSMTDAHFLHFLHTEISLNWRGLDIVVNQSNVEVPDVFRELTIYSAL